MCCISKPSKRRVFLTPSWLRAGTGKTSVNQWAFYIFRAPVARNWKFQIVFRYFNHIHPKEKDPIKEVTTFVNCLLKPAMLFAISTLLLEEFVCSFKFPLQLLTNLSATFMYVLRKTFHDESKAAQNFVGMQSIKSYQSLPKQDGVTKRSIIA